MITCKYQWNSVSKPFNIANILCVYVRRLRHILVNSLGNRVRTRLLSVISERYSETALGLHERQGERSLKNCSWKKLVAERIYCVTIAILKREKKEDLGEKLITIYASGVIDNKILSIVTCSVRISLLYDGWRRKTSH